MQKSYKYRPWILWNYWFHVQENRNSIHCIWNKSEACLILFNWMASELSQCLRLPNVFVLIENISFLISFGKEKQAKLFFDALAKNTLCDYSEAHANEYWFNIYMCIRIQWPLRVRWIMIYCDRLYGIMSCRISLFS